jgi:hypothetical protein
MPATLVELLPSSSTLKMEETGSSKTITKLLLDIKIITTITITTTTTTTVVVVIIMDVPPCDQLDMGTNVLEVPAASIFAVKEYIKCKNKAVAIY